MPRRRSFRRPFCRSLSRFVRKRAAAALVALAVLPSVRVPPAVAGEADVVAVEVHREGAGTYRFDVTVRHDDAGWDHYADAWEVLAPDGETVLGKRTLFHPHENEQPFTRSLSGVRIPDGVTEVIVRAHDKVHGYGGAAMRVTVSE
jgi:hypothetical protein